MFAEKDAKILANVCWKRELCRDVPDWGTVKKPVICSLLSDPWLNHGVFKPLLPSVGKTPKVYRKPNAGPYVTLRS